MGTKGQAAWNRVEFDDTNLMFLYVEMKEPVTVIAERFNCGTGSVYRRLRELGVVRTNAEAHKGQVPWNRVGRYTDGHGYIMLLLDEDDPYYCMTMKGGYIREHRHVMAEYLGRPLESWEIVHHINGIRDDNDIENLEIYPEQGTHLAVTMMQKEIKRLREELAALKAVEVT